MQLHNANLKACVHWRHFLVKMIVTATNYLLALATLGDVTQIGLFLFYAAPPKVAKASTLSVAATVAIALNFANGNTALQNILF